MAELRTQTVSNGKTVSVTTDESGRGPKRPSHIAHSAEDAENRWDYLCGSRNPFDTAMNTMARIKRSSCGNVRKPEEWDVAYE